MKKIRIGIVVPALCGWMGGINYLKNLLKAVASLDDKKIEFVLFFGEKFNMDVIFSFENLGTIVKTPILDDSNIIGFFNSIFWRLFGGSFFMRNEFEKNNIEIVSHSRFFWKSNNYRIINWIPDFQHLHLPKMFSVLEYIYRNYLFKSYVKDSSVVILSSKDAFYDYKKMFPSYIEKARVLQFVSQLNNKIYEIHSTKQVEEKYGFSGKFFYLPNQLWKHKNHMIVLKAIVELKKEKKEILVLCSGDTNDYRNKSHFKEIKKYMKDNALENNIKFLGVIDYNDVLTLMRHCVSIINPSLFEGWSSTVEEAKSIGKNMILSNLDVHIEQNPLNSVYFDSLNEKDLAEKMWQKWQKSEGGPDFDLEECARESIKQRTKEFGTKYQNIILEIFKNN